MSSLDDLIGRAKVLRAEGHSPGQIADELSLSMETVTWLLTQAKGTTAPKDVHIDWTAVSSHAPLLEETALMLLNGSSSHGMTILPGLLQLRSSWVLRSREFRLQR